MSLFGRQNIPRIPSNIEIPGITFVNDDHIEFREEYLDKCRDTVAKLLTKDFSEKLNEDGVPAGEIMIAATVNGDERYHSLRVIFQNLYNMKLYFKVVKQDGEILVRVDDVNKASFFSLPNKHRIGLVKTPEKVYKYIPDKILRYVRSYGYPGKEVPIAMEYNLSSNELKIYTGITGRSMSEYKLTIVDVGVWVSEGEMKAAIKAVTGTD